MSQSIDPRSDCENSRPKAETLVGIKPVVATKIAMTLDTNSDFLTDLVCWDNGSVTRMMSASNGFMRFLYMLTGESMGPDSIDENRFGHWIIRTQALGKHNQCIDLYVDSIESDPELSHSSCPKFSDVHGMSSFTRLG